MKYIKANPFVTLSLLVMLNITTCYVVSVRLGHVYPVIPFISETGSHPPESCFLSVMANIGSVCLLFCVWIRSQQVENYVSQQTPGRQQRNMLASNQLGYRMGVFMFTAVNLFGVANIQELNLLTIHMMAAGSFFVGTALFMHFQSSISTHTQLCSPFTAKLRRRQAQLQAFMVLLTMSFGVASISQLNGKDLRDLTPADHGHLCHALSAICEYAALLNMAAFLLSFYEESGHLPVQLPEVYVVDEGDRVHDRPTEEEYLQFQTPSIQSVFCYMLSTVIGINC